MKYTFAQILICALSSTYWLSSCGMIFDVFSNVAVCTTGIIVTPLASLTSVILVALMAPRGQKHMASGLFIWLLSALFVYSFSHT